ncbi:MAG: hypothetical protein QOD60_2489, partial [Solirubrobacterales bacterium]|nr:hypothetical protein [Solirubrobacterales bacterium]
MKRTLTLAIALGTALAVIAAGTASSVTLDLGGGLAVHVPTGGILPQCSDLEDNNGNGLVDLQDPGCSGPLDTTEATPAQGSGGGATGGGANGTPAPGGKAGSTVTPALGKNGKKVKPGFNVRPGGVTGGVTGPDAKQGLQLPTLPQRNPDGTPTNANPTLSVASFGPAPLGVPNFIIDQFEIPPFLLPIYQACGTQYGIPWQVLASINRIETAFGTNL